MSWSIGFIGKTSDVVNALKAESDKQTGASKQEYDASLPFMVGLVQQNVEKDGEPIVKVEANGHGYIENGIAVSNQVKVSVERFYGNLV